MSTTAAPADASDAEYTELVRKLEALSGKSDIAERTKVQKRIAEILASRRKTDRFQCFVTVAVKAGSINGPGTLINLGAGGGYVKTALTLEKLSSITIEVKQTGRLAAGLVFPCQVRWVKPGHGVGVAFQELGAKEQDALKKALGELVREQPPQRPT